MQLAIRSCEMLCQRTPPGFYVNGVPVKLAQLLICDCFCDAEQKSQWAQPQKSLTFPAIEPLNCLKYGMFIYSSSIFKMFLKHYKLYNNFSVFRRSKSTKNTISFIYTFGDKNRSLYLILAQLK